jgi:anti-sigma B factor antagonist
MAVRRKDVGEVVVVYPKGSFFGGDETDELEKTIMDVAASGNQRLLINLSDCEALNSSAIAVLTRGYVHYKNKGGEVKLCGLGKRVKAIFVLTKLIMLFDHHDTEEAALAAFAKPVA